MTTRLLWAIAAMTVFIGLGGAPATAQINCPDGFRAVPRANGWTCEGMPYVPDGRRQPKAPTPHPSESLTRAMETHSRLMADFRAAVGGMRQSPRIAAFRDGRLWEYPANQCSATLMHPNGMINIRMPDKDNEAVQILYHSTDIPRAERTARLKVEVDQTSLDTGQHFKGSIDAVHLSLPNDPAGYLAMHYAPSSAEEFLGAFGDKMKVAISLKGKRVIDIGWQDGNQAKARLRKCMR